MKIILLISTVLFSQISLAKNLDSSPMNCQAQADLVSSQTLPKDENSNILSSALFESREQTDHCPEIIGIIKTNGSKILMQLSEVSEKACLYNLTSDVIYAVSCDLDSSGIL